MSSAADSPERKKSKSSPELSEDDSSRAGSSEVESPAVRPEYSSGKLFYPNKGPNHTIEHVYDLDCQHLRQIHWQECVLSNGSESLAKALASAEQRDCLSTVFLAFTNRDYGTGLTEAQLDAQKLGLSCQPMPREMVHWEEEMGNEELGQLIWPDLSESEEDLRKLYEIDWYYEEAKRRAHAVNHIISRIPEKDQKKIRTYDVLYRMLEDKLAEQTHEPRVRVLERVALFHWFLKTDLTKNFRIPLI
jgi:hypothetical protein